MLRYLWSYKASASKQFPSIYSGSAESNILFSRRQYVIPQRHFTSFFQGAQLLTPKIPWMSIKREKSPLNQEAMMSYVQCRFRSDFAPRHNKYRKKQKGRVPVRTGGSTKGNTIVYGDYGLRVKDGVRLSSSQLTAAHSAIKRKIKVVKGSKIWMRVFPDIPVTSKGNETRMGKGKGSFEYWACRVPMNKIVFEIGGGGMRRETAKEALRLASDKLPVKTEFVVAERTSNSTPETSTMLTDKSDDSKDNLVQSQIVGDA